MLPFRVGVIYKNKVRLSIGKHSVIQTYFIFVYEKTAREYLAISGNKKARTSFREMRFKSTFVTRTRLLNSMFFMNEVRRARRDAIN